MRHTLTTQQGFSLVEVMIAMFILAVGLLTLVIMQTTGIMGNATANRISTSVDWGGSRIEQLLSLPYDDPLLVDKNTLGTAGLNAASAATADGSVVSPDGLYTIFWNVANDQFLPNLKTIRVIVNRNEQGQSRSTTMNYIKARYN